MEHYWDTSCTLSDYSRNLTKERLEEEGAAALKETIKFQQCSTRWERTCTLNVGKTDDFAEDEKNALEELLDEFINDYLVANPTKGKDAQDILDYSKAIEIDPNNAEAYYRRGLAYAKQGQRDYNNKVLWNRAISDFSKAIEINARYAEAYNNRGLAYTANSDYDKAISDFTKVIEIEPKNAEAYSNRGYANEIKSKYAQAILDFSKVIEIDQSNAEAHLRRGWAYYFTNEYDKALEDVNKAQSLGYIRQDFLNDLRESIHKQKDLLR
jgi:tetratricopeptide (TPR) repeat protein